MPRQRQQPFASGEELSQGLRSGPQVVCSGPLPVVLKSLTLHACWATVHYISVIGVQHATLMCICFYLPCYSNKPTLRPCTPAAGGGGQLPVCMRERLGI
jgi:hypothetical protein